MRCLIAAPKERSCCSHQWQQKRREAPTFPTMRARSLCSTLCGRWPRSSGRQGSRYASLLGRSIPTCGLESAEASGDNVNAASRARAERAAQLPMQRFARPEEVASAALFRTDPQNRYITGVSLETLPGRCPLKRMGTLRSIQMSTARPAVDDAPGERLSAGGPNGRALAGSSWPSVRIRARAVGRAREVQAASPRCQTCKAWRNALEDHRVGRPSPTIDGMGRGQVRVS